MNRRTYLAAAASVPAASTWDARPIPPYRVFTSFQSAPRPRMPRPYPGRGVLGRASLFLSGFLSAVLASALVLASTGVAPAADSPGRSRFYVTSAAASLVEQGLAAAAPGDAEASGFQTVPAPGIRFQANQAGATASPWVDSNGWRF